MTPLELARNLLVRRWGEMGGYWGINRTMAEIHALLFVSHEPLCTDDIMNQLKISRGNASMNLRALVDWGLIQRVHKLGDRKEYFEADTDVWHMFETIMRERRRREVEPIIATLDRCIAMVRAANAAPRTSAAPAGNGDSAAPPAAAASVAEFSRRAGELRDFLAAMGRLFEFVLDVGSAGLEPLLRSFPASQSDGAPPASRRSAGRAARPPGERSRRGRGAAPRG